MKRSEFRNLALALIALLCGLLPIAASAENLTIQGRSFYRDGKPWLPKGVHVGAFNRPLNIASGPKWMNDASAQLRTTWGPEELNAVKRVFAADTIRLDVSQPALDPKSPIYDPAYLTDLLSGVKLARSSGFVVIVVVNSQAPSGLADLPCMPNDSTVRAWKTLAPSLMNDQGIMLELFNEPCKSLNAGSKAEWVASMQAMIDAVRGGGATNILLLDGLWWARTTNGLFPLVHDKLPNRMALAVHPYLIKDAYVNEAQWRNQFGASAGQFPMIVTEWNAVSTGTCVGDDLPAIALAEMRYLATLHVGVIGWGIDSNTGKLVKDHVKFEPTDYAGFAGCTKTPTDAGGGQLLVRYPNE